MAIDRLLVAIGPDDRDRVDELARATIDIATPGTTTVLLSYVFPQDEYDGLVEEMDIDPTAGDIPPDELASRHASVSETVARLEEAGIECDVRGVIGGKQADQILRIAEENEAGHIVVGGSPRSPTGKAVFGDRAQQVLLNASCPVTYVASE